MPAEKHEVVVIGGGQNGLIVAGYLAKAGVDVCVVEIKDKVGGGAISEELTLPGFIHDPGAVMHGMISLNPVIRRDELGLASKYGFNYYFAEKQFALIYPDDRALIFYLDIDKTCESISQFSQHDAEAYRNFHKSTMDMLKVASVAGFSPAPAWGAMMSLFDSSEEGREFLRIIMSSAVEIAEDWFESDQMKIALTRFASEVMVAPQEKGTGQAMFFIGSLHARGWGLPIGGSGALTDALAAQIKDNGGTIKVSSPVKSVKVEGGEAKGVILESGDEILATKAVVANVNVKQLFLDMLKPEELPAGLPDRVRRVRHATFSAINQGLALNEPPKFTSGEDMNDVFHVEWAPYPMENFLRSFEDYNYGICNFGTPTLVTATIFDPSRAPEGKHTGWLYHYAPYNLKDGGPSKWDEVKQEVADGVLATVRRHTTNMGDDNILGRWIQSPLDMERRFPSMLHGDLGHIAQFITQWFAYRPLPGLGQYRTPIGKLYLSGAGTHPGLGVSGGGRATVQVIMEDLGIDFREVAKR